MANFISKFTNFLGGGKDKEAEQAQQNALAQFSFDAPEERPLNLEQVGYEGDYSPEELAALRQGDTNLRGVQVDPRLKAAQLQALGGFQDIVDSDGLTAEDQYRLSQINSDQAGRERGSREAILQNAQQRGVAGSGLELLSQLQNQQDSATRANAQALGVNAQAQAAKRAALEGLASTGGSIRSQDYGEQAAAAQAQDAIDRFNTANTQDVSKFNVNNVNTAAQRNLNMRQELAGQNTGIRNQAATVNQGAAQRAFDNRSSLASARAGVLQGTAKQFGQQADANRGVVRDVAGLVKKGAKSAASAYGGGA
jgi:hypothetical protein